MTSNLQKYQNHESPGKNKELFWVEEHMTTKWICNSKPDPYDIQDIIGTTGETWMESED